MATESPDGKGEEEIIREGVCTSRDNPDSFDRRGIKPRTRMTKKDGLFLVTSPHRKRKRQ
jgi:hypothetical protein